MNVWIVIDRYDHSERITTAHLTEKGAMIQAYNILLEALDNLLGGYADGSEDDEVFSDTNIFPIGCILSMEKITL